MNNLYNWPIWHWHFEISSICTLRCPRCPRSEIPESLVQSQLRLNFFKENFYFADQIKKITFCGDDGDPIYARDLVPVIDFFKLKNPTVNINIITNGSYKSAGWWQSLGNVLNEHDTVQFSLDGWDQKSNEIYRVNSDWDSIINGVRSLKSNTKALLQWDAIAFRHNQNKIEKMKSMAVDLEFDAFQLTKSTKFGSKYSHYNDPGSMVDSLEPDQSLIAPGHRFTRETVNLSGRKTNNNLALLENINYYKTVKEKSKHKKIVPLCMIGTKGMFVNSQGYLIPCCWIGNRYNHTGVKKFSTPENNIKINGIDSVLNAAHWDKFIDEFENNKECNDKCLSNLVDEQYATNW
jgi:MoaA/NifB/PqqE/SkfB family radical SAM enzyme